MNPRQIELVKNSFEQVLPISETAAELFYARLFELEPSLRFMFKGDMREQGRKLMLMLKVAVTSLDKLETIVPAVQALGARHSGYGVEDWHYDVVAEALLWTLAKGLGESFTAETRDAWVAAYTVLADTMKAASANPPAQGARQRVLAGAIV